MADYYWKGDTSDDATVAANWVTASEGSTKHTTLPVDGDSVYFDATSEAHNNCVLSGFSSSPHSGYFPSNSSHKLANFEIKDTFRSRVIEITAALTINLSGQLIIDEEKRLSIGSATTFVFNSAPNITTYNSAGSATTKAFVRLINAETSFVDDASRSNTTFNFGSQNFTMIDGIYPKITGTGNLQAKSVFSDASRALHNTYGSVDMLDINGIGVTSGDYDIYDYDKQFYFEGALTAIADTFKFGHTTARFKANSTGAKLPVNGERNTNAYGNDTNKTFYAEYHKVVIENGGSSNFWFISAGLTLDCNELVINDGGRLYGPSSGTRAATIKSVKRPTVRGDWNFRQITDGIYESVNDASNTSVYEGGTGRQTLTNNAILYGQGMDQVGLDTDFTYDPAEKFLEVEKVKSHIVIQVKNETGSTIPKGAAVYVDDNGTTPLVALACGDSASKMPAIGLVMEQIADNNTGYTAVNGIITISSSQIEDTLSDPADIGKILYVSSTNPGKLTINKPQYSNHLIQNVGNIATISGGNVKVTISNIGRTNDTPNTALHPIFFERSPLNTNLYDFRSPTATGATAIPNGFPMPFNGRVVAATFLFAGGTPTGTATNTIRIRKNGGSSGSDIQEFTFTPSDLTNTNGNNWTLVKTGADVDFDFSAGDVLQVRRESGTTNLYNGQAVLWVKFD